MAMCCNCNVIKGEWKIRIFQFSNRKYSPFTEYIYCTPCKDVEEDLLKGDSTKFTVTPIEDVWSVS